MPESIEHLGRDGAEREGDDRVDSGGEDGAREERHTWNEDAGGSEGGGGGEAEREAEARPESGPGTD